MGCAASPPWAKPAVQQLQLGSQAALASLLGASALLVQAASSGDVQAACDSLPLPLAVATAAVMGSMQHWAAADTRLLGTSCCRLLSALLGQQATAATFLQRAGEEHQLAADESSGVAVGAALCTQLIELFVEAAAAAESQAEQPAEHQARWQHVESALGGLLAFSHSAKEVAVAVGLPRSLTETCLALAAARPSAAPAVGPALPVTTASAASRVAKLQQLRQRRQGGARQPTATLAFGRVSSSAAARPGSMQRPLEHHEEQPQQREPAAEEGEPQQQAEVGPSPAAAPAPCSGQQRLALCLGLMQQLAHCSRSGSDSLMDAGLMDAATRLWGTGGAPVQHALLSLLASVLSNSPAARQACAATGKCA